ncbi:DUF7144 family membrane protein [Marinitenerispora sediminis]|uniref:DUF7144 domain-containing protein n=1 Tax=Marinitenerispora sediminis TaxID=1931232 RepID=A0A368SYL4_9ACTN|nr:hypothetical protein [Marinitenerispora sediminis]RCV48601.1 hypothetical protein DEF28_23030 [Marinitenerispora sediminis]RCV49616.1 hypothetical protein DEF24_25070 [Marinitenerispora sediminis]RCV50335.1 hypothetical protein DEF23_22225 [Marinitenerispora sediminis]
MTDTFTGGWSVFTATMLLIVAACNIVQGIVAVVAPTAFVTGSGRVLLLNLVSWGVLLAAWGLVMLAAAGALIGGQAWTRLLACVLAGVNVLFQLGFVIAVPTWALVVVALDVVVIYGLAVGWPREEAAAGYLAGRADAATGRAAAGGSAEERAPGRPLTEEPGRPATGGAPPPRP